MPSLDSFSSRFDPATSSGLPPSLAGVSAATSNPGGPSSSAMPSPPASPLDAMVGEMKAMTPELAKMQEKRGAQDERAVGAAQARENEDRQRMMKAFDATAYSRDAIPPPWNAPKEAADRTTDLWSAFGSPAMVFATLASAFTHQPMVNSLNAGAAVLNAFHAGDQRAYERDFAAWKANTDLAVKRHGMEREAFDDAMKIMDHDQRAGREALMRNAQVFNDKRALFMLQHGWDKELFDMMGERARTGMEMMKQQKEIQKWNTVNTIAMNDERWKTGGEIGKQMAILSAEAQVVGAEHGKVPGGPGQGGATVSDKAAELAADAAMHGSFDLMNKYGRGVQGSANLDKIMQIMADKGATGETIREAQNIKSGQMKANRDFSTGKQGQQINSFNVSIAHLDTFRELAEAMKNGDTQAVNRINNALKSQFGYPDVSNFNAAKQIISNEVIKAIVSSGGGVRDREEAQSVFNAANSPAQLHGAIETVQKLLVGQVMGLKKQYEQTTGMTNFDERLTDDAKNVVERYGPKINLPNAGVREFDLGDGWSVEVH